MEWQRSADRACSCVDETVFARVTAFRSNGRAASPRNANRRRLLNRRRRSGVAALVHLATILALAAAPSSPASAEEERVRLLSAFYGLDDSWRIRVRAAWACRGVPGGDGMPVIFSHEVDPATLGVGDVRIVRASGAIGRVDCVTLRPADEPGERRTALVIGQYGSVDDPPVTVEITGDVRTSDGTLTFRGASVNVTPLAAGPTLVLAEEVASSDWSLGGRGDCPRVGLLGIVRVTWSGGVTKPGGDEIDRAEVALYRVTLQKDDGTLVTVSPMAVGDLGDNDNNHELCIDVSGVPLSVSFPGGALIDPNEKRKRKSKKKKKNKE
jgi:hypothetical protein